MSGSWTITEAEFSLLPEDNVNHGSYAVQVSYRGDGRWAVVHRRFCLSVDGEWEFEARPSERDDEWLATHRFTYAEACSRAVDAAYDIEVNGISARDLLRMIANQAAGLYERTDKPA